MPLLITLDPPNINLVGGGAAVQQKVTVTGMPPDSTVQQVIEVIVGTATAQVTTTVVVDNPECIVVANSPTPAYTTSVSYPSGVPHAHTEEDEPEVEATSPTAVITYTPA